MLLKDLTMISVWNRCDTGGATVCTYNVPRSGPINTLLCVCVCVSYYM